MHPFFEAQIGWNVAEQFGACRRRERARVGRVVGR